MNSLFNFVSDAYAMAPATQGGQPGGQSMIASLLPLVLIFVVFYFLLIRPQQKKAKEHKQMIDNLKRGDKIVTGGGIYAVVETVNDNTVVIKIADNVKIKIGKGYISALRSSADED